MRQYLTGIVMVTATIGVIYAGSARAAPPPPSWEGSFRLPQIVCHSAEQVKQLVEAQKVSDAKLIEVKTSMGDKCQPAYIHNVVVGESEDLGIVKTGATSEHLWVLHIGTPKEDFFSLYEEKADAGTAI